MSTAVQKSPGAIAPIEPGALQTLMARAGLAVAVLDGTGHLSMVSPRLEHLVHSTFAAVPAESLAQVFHLFTPDGTRLLEPHEVPIVRAARGELVEDAVVTVRAPGQPVRHLRVDATPIVGVHGEPQGAWAIVSDVTSLVAAARGELGAKLAETVNHDLRTPLTTLLCHAELLLDRRDDLPPDVARSLDAVWRAGQRLSSVATSISEWIDLVCTREADGGPDGSVDPPWGLEQAVPGPAPVSGTDRGRDTDLAELLDLVDDGILGLDRNGRLRVVNEAAGRLLRPDAGDPHGQGILEVFPPALGSVLDHHCRAALRSGRRVEFETFAEPRNVWISVHIHPSADGVALALRDVTSVHSLMTERRTFAEQLLWAEERERARIAAGVHEDSLQALGAVGIHLQLLQAQVPASDPVARDLLERLGEEVAEGTRRLRSLLFSLEPTRTDVSTAQEIRAQAAHIFAGSSISWCVDDVDAGEDLAPAERGQALRVTKEALTNVRAHSRATEVVVTLVGDEAGVEIVIADNGRAADPADLTSPLGHRGLETMRDRATAVGGRCSVEPATPHGCVVRLHVPRVRP